MACGGSVPVMEQTAGVVRVQYTTGVPVRIVKKGGNGAVWFWQRGSRQGAWWQKAAPRGTACPWGRKRCSTAPARRESAQAVYGSGTNAAEMGR